ncbi:MAG: cupin domain-containing protein [Planctomycetota bacterium]
MDRFKIGSRLNALRRRKGVSLRALSRSTGVAPSFLSAIEREANSVSVAKLKTILDGLGVSLSEFFSHPSPPAAKVVYRRKELSEISGSKAGLLYLEVAAGRPGRALQLILESYARGADTGPGLYRHEAEEAGVVLKGKLELTVDNEIFVLGPGDAYYFDSRHPHRFRNVGKGAVQAVSVNTPPSF